MSTLRELIVTPAELRSINTALALLETDLESGGYDFMKPQERSALVTATARARTKVHMKMKPEDYEK